MNRTVIGVIVAVLLASVGTLMLVLYVQGAEARALAGQETVEVLVVTEPVARGTAAADLDGAVSTEMVPAKVRAEGYVSDLGELDGQLTSVDLLPGEQLVAARFLSPEDFADDRGVDVPEGLQEVTVSLDPQRVLGGQLRPGHTVGVFASFTLVDEADDEEDGGALDSATPTTKKILDQVLVTNVQLEQMRPIPLEDDEDDSGPELAPTGNLLVTFAVDVERAERIVFTAEHGTIWLTLQAEGTDESGSRLRVPRNIYDD